MTFSVKARSEKAAQKIATVALIDEMVLVRAAGMDVGDERQISGRRSECFSIHGGREDGGMAEPDEVARLEERVQVLEDALRFYADRDNWRALKLEDQFETGPAVDLGKRAREALSGPGGAWPTP